MKLKNIDKDPNIHLGFKRKIVKHVFQLFDGFFTKEFVLTAKMISFFIISSVLFSSLFFIKSDY
jgi:hypothetical protein